MEELKGKHELEVKECSQAMYSWHPYRPSPSYSVGKRGNYHKDCKNLSGLFRIN